MFWKGGYSFWKEGYIKAMIKPANFDKTCEYYSVGTALPVLIGDLVFTPRMLFIGSRNPLQIGRFRGVLNWREFLVGCFNKSSLWLAGWRRPVPLTIQIKMIFLRLFLSLSHSQGGGAGFKHRLPPAIFVKAGGLYTHWVCREALLLDTTTREEYKR